MHPPQPTTRHSSFLHSLPHKASPSFEALSSPTCSVRTTTTAATAESPCSSMASGRTAHWELAPRIPLFPLNLSGDAVSPSSHASSSSASSSSCSTLGFLDVFAPNTASFPRSSSLASLSSNSGSSTPSSKSAFALPLTPSPTPPRYIHATTTRRALSCLPEEREPNSTPVSIVPKRVVSALQLGSPFRSSASCTDFTALAALGKADSEATVQSSTSLINAAARLEPSPLSAQLDSMHATSSSSSIPAIVTPPTTNPVLLISPAPSSTALEPSPRYLASIFSASSAGDSPAWGAPVGVRPTPPPRPPRRRPVSTATLKSITPSAAAEDEQSDAALADASDDAGSMFGSLDTPQQPRQAIRAVAAPRRQKRTAEQFRKLSNAREQHYRSSNANGKERSTSVTTKLVRPGSAGSHVVRPRSRHASTHSRVHAGCALGLPMAFRLVRKKRKMRVQDLPSMQAPLRVELPEVTVIKGQAEVVVIARQAPTSPNTRNLARKPVVLHAAESQTPLLQAVGSPVQPPPPAPRLSSKKWTADSSPSDAGSPTWLPLPPVSGARVRKAKSQLIVPSSGSGTSQRSSSDSNGRSSARRAERSSLSQRSRGGASSTYDDMQMVAGSLLEAAASSQASLRSSQPSPTSLTAPRSSLAPPVNEAHLAVKPKRSSRLMRALSSMSLRPHAAASSMEQQRASMDIGAPSLVSTSASLDELDCRAVFDVHGNGSRASASISRATSPKPSTSLAPPPTLPTRASSRASETSPEAALPTPVVQAVTPPRLASRSRVVTPSNAAAEQGEALVLAASDSSNLLATYEGASLLLAFYAAQLGIEEEGAAATVAGASMRNSGSADRAPSFGSGSANASPSSSSGASATSLDSDLYDGRRLVRAFWNEGEDGSSDSRRGSGDARSFVAPPSPVVAPLAKAKSQQLLRARVDPLQVNTLPFPAL